MAGKVEAIEPVPPAVQTGLPPLATRPGYQPVADIDEVMVLLRRDPNPREVLVERVAFTATPDRNTV